ncbi:MAG: hypothetical protein J1G30_10075, partial [Spirochaetales bacterium]|nr:hypothetical protein [Spirochaetales bacterium]
KRYVIVGQPQLDKAIREANFTAGNSDEAAAIKVGERAEAEIVVMTKITSLRSQILINIRAIDVITGEVTFAESEAAMSYDVIKLAEKIARRFSGTESSGKYNVSFSISDDLDNLPLKNSEKKFVAKKLQQKWEIDLDDAEQVHGVYKKYINAGIALSVIGGVLTLTSIPLMAVGGFIIDVLSPYDYYDGWDHESRRDITLDIIGSVLLTSGILMVLTSFMVPLSAYPFINAQRIKNIYKKLHGGQSFNIRPSFSSVYDPKQKQDRMQIALSLQF